MAIVQNQSDHHWNYLLALESDLEQLSRYVEFTERNYDCFSIEMARILMAAGAEIDVVCKQLCQQLTIGSGSTTTAANIHEYRDIINSRYPKVQRFQVQLPRYGLELRPWDEWKNQNGVPFWWTGYNKTKHERHTEYHQASLKNALNAVAGLFVVTLFLYRGKAEDARLKPVPKLLKAGPEFLGGMESDGYDFAHVYRLGGF
jgi:hypothetical protein